jgi:hypothetical protein
MKARAGGWVEVLSKQEILRTLDKNGRDVLRATKRQSVAAKARYSCKASATEHFIAVGGCSVLAASICGGAKSDSNTTPSTRVLEPLSPFTRPARAQRREHIHST